MSQEEFHLGKLRKIEVENIEDFCKQKCLEKGITELRTYHKDWKDSFRDQYYEKYIIVDDIIYEIFEHNEFEYDDIYYLKDNKDGTFDFVMKFYNGGTCLTECIEEELMKLKK